MVAAQEAPPLGPRPRVGVKRSRERPPRPQPPSARRDRRLTPTRATLPLIPTIDGQGRGAPPTANRPALPTTTDHKPPFPDGRRLCPSRQPRTEHRPSHHRPRFTHGMFAI